MATGTKLRTAMAALLLAPAAMAADAPPEKPNIVFFLVDDLGWKDVGFHGGHYETPNIDRLAAGGTRLECLYALPVCSPTRAALLTGRHPIRYGLQAGVVRPWARYGLPLEERTLAQALKDAGYFTAICGKWHLGHFTPAYLPTRRGFDHQYGHYNGAIDYNTHIRDGGFDWHRNDRVCRDEGYTTHLLAGEAAKLVEEHGGRQPLFLYVPFNAIHAPHQVPPRYAEPYRNRPGVNADIGGMVAALDEAVGRIAGAFAEKGLTERTLFVFASDNGGPIQGSNGPLRGRKGSLYEGGIRVAAFASWKGVIPAGRVIEEPLHMTDWYPTLVRLAGGSLDQPLPLDGKDIWPVLSGSKPSPHEEILLNAEPSGGALRWGPWKLVISRPPERTGSGGKPGAGKSSSELFNLQSDPGEKQNLADAEPERLRELRKRYEAYLREAAPALATPKPKDYKAPAVWGE
jgi:arylsulfatase A-like enzyme